ncbi:hypothetical protein C0J52_25732 [Blattella germanica]|nr:hypothetical protein C0J52_25732 [Blattella germanica]
MPIRAKGNQVQEVNLKVRATNQITHPNLPPPSMVMVFSSHFVLYWCVVVQYGFGGAVVKKQPCGQKNLLIFKLKFGTMFFLDDIPHYLNYGVVINIVNALCCGSSQQKSTKNQNTILQLPSHMSIAIGLELLCMEMYYATRANGSAL